MQMIKTKTILFLILVFVLSAIVGYMAGKTIARKSAQNEISKGPEGSFVGDVFGGGEPTNI